MHGGWGRALQVKAVATRRHYAEPPRPMMTLDLADQAGLLGLLFRIHKLGLTVLAVELSAVQTD